MATLHDGIPRKKLATYGKAARRRIPEYDFLSATSTSKAHASSLQKLNEVEPNKAAAPVATTNAKFNTSLSHSKPAARSQASAQADIFDVPVSEDEARAPPPRLKKTKKQAPKQKPSPAEERSSVETTTSNTNMKLNISIQNTTSSPKLSITNGIAMVTIDDREQRKRLKLSPPHGDGLRRLPINTKTHLLNAQPSNRTTKKTSPPVVNRASNIVIKPKLYARIGSKQAVVPPKVPVHDQLQQLPTYHGSPPLSDVEMLDVPPLEQHISPKEKQLWQGLLGSEDGSQLDSFSSSNRGRDVSLASGNGPTSGGGRTLFKPASISKTSQKGSRNLTRKRLIDSLVEQAIDHEASSASDSDSQYDLDTTATVDTVMSDDIKRNVRDESLAPDPVAQFTSGSQHSQVVGPKYVYGRQRTILAETDFMKELEIGMPVPTHQDTDNRRNRRGSIPALPILTSFHEIHEEEDDISSTAIRSVHELRQAGATNRFLDEIDDFIERIGKPGAVQASMRRSGLLDLAAKMRDKGFARQFRANGAEHKLFVHLGQETDVIAGFVMVSLLVTNLTEGNMPHIVPQLRRQGITRLFIRLLAVQSSILGISKDRKYNMSKIGQSLVAEHHDYLLQLAIWDDRKPHTLTPRTLALKCLEKMVRQTREAGHSGDIFSKELTTNLFTILKTAMDEETWTSPNKSSAADFHLSLSALESHSITARTAKDESIWTADFLPVIAEALQAALSRPIEDFGEIQLLMLRLALNVTNNNPKGADVFARPKLLALMGHVIVANFMKIARFIREEELFIVMDYLVLVLGVMINFAEWSTVARESLQSLEGKENDPLESMAQLFVDNQERMSEADSVEESQKNVAFGYLSVLLGYFSLQPALALRIRQQHPRRTLRPLISSIEEFIGHHKTVDDLIAADPDGYNPHSGLTERLESLVRRLSQV